MQCVWTRCSCVSVSAQSRGANTYRAHYSTPRRSYCTVRRRVYSSVKTCSHCGVIEVITLHFTVITVLPPCYASNAFALNIFEMLHFSAWIHSLICSRFLRSSPHCITATQARTWRGTTAHRRNLSSCLPACTGFWEPWIRAPGGHEQRCISAPSENSLTPPAS